MSRSLHKFLNAVLPMGVRKGLKRFAEGFIPTLRHLNMPVRLRHMASLGFKPAVILDIGAATGEWARMAHEIWPGAKVYGFEPNRRNAPDLEQTRRDVPRFDFRICFLGPQRKTVEYFDNDTQTSLLDGSGHGTKQSSEMLVLDELIASGDVPRPDFMKLDVQGFELDVLAGAQEAMRNAQGVLLEVSFTEFLPGVPTIERVVAYMNERGFSWYDVMGILRSPENDALWQMDVMFIKKDHPLRRNPG